MKRLELTLVEVRTLRDMGIFHSHPRTRMRAQAIVRLSQGLTLQQPSVSVYTIKRYLKNAQMRYKRYRYSLKKNEMQRPLTAPEP